MKKILLILAFILPLLAGAQTKTFNNIKVKGDILITSVAQQNLLDSILCYDPSDSLFKFRDLSTIKIDTTNLSNRIDSTDVDVIQNAADIATIQGDYLVSADTNNLSDRLDTTSTIIAVHEDSIQVHTDSIYAISARVTALPTGGDNMANADLTLDENRSHTLATRSLDFDGLFKIYGTTYTSLARGIAIGPGQTINEQANILIGRDSDVSGLFSVNIGNNNSLSGTGTAARDQYCLGSEINMASVPYCTSIGSEINMSGITGRTVAVGNYITLTGTSRYYFGGGFIAGAGNATNGLDNSIAFGVNSITPSMWIIGLGAATNQGNIGIGTSTATSRITTLGTGTTDATSNTLLQGSGGLDLFEVKDDGDIYSLGLQGLSATYTFGGGTTGDIATMTYTNGILTGITLVP
ncbi:MAG: hypothetical protein QNK20_16790 [Aureibaculum sp.]|nr:hypothetical protein [Aureibaculum sp.]